MTERDSPSTTRRGIMKGVGGLAALSMSNATAAQAQAILETPLESDPHTVDTYRSIVDAILPLTPGLEDEPGFGPEHVPGGLNVELEKFLIWDFNHFQEIRSETITEPGAIPGPGQTSPSTFELGLDLTGPGSALEALAGLDDDPPELGIGASATEALGIATSSVDVAGVDTAVLGELLDFGATDHLSVAFADPDPGGEGVEAFELDVQASGEAYHEVLQNYPYANLFPYAFDLAAADFLARGANEDQPAPNGDFPAGGTFVRLSREDRLRCLWTIVDGGAIDRLDGLLEPLLPAVGLLKYVVMACNGLHGFGYYTEWSGYGETKTATQTEREMQVDPGETQSRVQTGYPGPSDGYAADWRHAVDGGFTDEWDDGGAAPPGDPPADPPGDTPADPPAGASDGSPAGVPVDLPVELPDAVADAFGGDLL